jgi:putative aldouronate transport system substrate-binding protein
MKKRLAAALSLAITLSAAAGCGSDGDKETAPAASASPLASAAATATAKPAAPVKLEVAQISWGASVPADDFVKKELDKKLNLQLTQLLVADQKDYENQINVRAASNNLPDLFMATSKAHVQKLAESGMLLDLTPYLDKLADYKNFAGADVLKKGIVNGKQYALPKAGQAVTHTYWIRKDWLDALKLQPPTSIDELLNVAKAFTENDPDGNGKKDTFGLTGTALATFEPIYGAHGVSSAGAFFQKDGAEVVNTYYQPGMKDALAAVKKFLDAGVVDPEVISNKGTAARDKAFQGKVGIINSEWAQFMKEDAMKIWKDANPKAEWIQLAAPKGPSGIANANSINIGAASGLFVIPKSLEGQQEKLNKIFEVLNYLSTEEGNLLVQFGLKGTHFTLENGKAAMTEQGKKDTGFTWLYQYTGRQETEYLKTKFPTVTAYIDFEAKLPRIKTLDGFVQNPQGFNAADATRYIEEETFKFIYGKRDLNEYDKFLQTLETTFGYKAYVESAIKQLKDLGYGK